MSPCWKFTTPWQRGESSPKSYSELISASFYTKAKVTAQDFGTMKKQRAVSMLSSSTKTNKQKKISHSSPIKLQVLPLSQNSFLLYIFGVQSLSWLNTLFHEWETKASLFSYSGLYRTQAPWIHKHTQVGYLPRQASFAVWQNRAAMQACPCAPENPELSSRLDQTKPRMLHECWEVWPSSLPLGLHRWRNILAACVKQHYV